MAQAPDLHGLGSTANDHCAVGGFQAPSPKRRGLGRMTKPYPRSRIVAGGAETDELPMPSVNHGTRGRGRPTGSQIGRTTSHPRDTTGCHARGGCTGGSGLPKRRPRSCHGKEIGRSIGSSTRRQAGGDGRSAAGQLRLQVCGPCGGRMTRGGCESVETTPSTTAGAPLHASPRSGPTTAARGPQHGWAAGPDGGGHDASGWPRPAGERAAPWYPRNSQPRAGGSRDSAQLGAAVRFRSRVSVWRRRFLGPLAP